MRNELRKEKNGVIYLFAMIVFTSFLLLIARSILDEFDDKVRLYERSKVIKDKFSNERVKGSFLGVRSYTEYSFVSVDNCVLTTRDVRTYVKYEIGDEIKGLWFCEGENIFNYYEVARKERVKNEK